MKKLVIMGCVAFMLSGCATIAERTISDAALAREAGRALGIPADQLRISDRDHSAFYTYFVATGPDGRRNRCKIDAGGFSFGTFATNGANCNENIERNPFYDR